MGRIAKLLSFARSEVNGAKVSDVKVDPGGGANVTAQHFASPGDDSHPLPGDYVALTGVTGTGRANALGYLDPTNERKALPGDKRIYARDEDGATVVEVWLQNDGTAIVVNAQGSVTLRPDGSIRGSNGAGSFELESGGDFVVNGVTIDTSGNVTSPATVTAATVSAPSIQADGKELAGHIHPAGSPPGNTGPNT